MTHQKHLLYVQRNTTTMDSHHGITAPEAAVAEVVEYTPLREMTLRGARGDDHQDGHPTTIQTAFPEEDPQDHLVEALRAVGPAVTQDYGRCLFEITWGQKGKKRA